MVEKSVLDNGIRVITETVPSAHSVTVGIWVENGSRHETAEQNGISHFIEHMLFKGTAQRSALQIAKEIDSVGGILNGFTSREFSCYYAKVLAGQLPLAVDLLTDVVLNSVFAPEEIDKEHRVILQEIHMLEDTPDDHVHDLFSQAFWPGHSLGFPILGTRDSVGSLSRDRILEYLGERYCGRNIIVSAAGAVDHQTLVDRIAGTLHRVPAGQPATVEAVSRTGSGMRVDFKELEQVQVCLGTPALSQRDPHRFRLFILNAILGGSMSSRLFQIIREERGLAYSIYSYLNCHSDAGSLVVYSATSPEETPTVLRLILDQLRRLRDDGVSAEEVRFAQDQLKGNLLLSMESTDNLMTRIAKNEIYLGRHLALEELLAMLDQVDRAEVRDLAAAMFQDDQLTLQMVGPFAAGDFGEADLRLG